MIFAVDFDDTLFKTNFPFVVEPYMSVINACKNAKKQGHTLILWTCRQNDNLKIALDACKDFGLEFDYVNENPPEMNEFYNNDSRKVGADFYIDDKAMHPSDFIMMYGGNYEIENA